MKFNSLSDELAGLLALACAIAVFIAAVLDAPDASAIGRADRVAVVAP